jgi:hypothetical protein
MQLLYLHTLVLQDGDAAAAPLVGKLLAERPADFSALYLPGVKKQLQCSFFGPVLSQSQSLGAEIGLESRDRSFPIQVLKYRKLSLRVRCSPQLPVEPEKKAPSR